MALDLWYAKPDHIPVLGHRGICARYPENTLVSFEAALQLGVDLIEFDINITKDGVPVVIHDNAIDRTCDHRGLVRQYTLEELKSFDFSGKFPQYRGVKTPTFRELLELVKARSETVVLNVEIKDKTPECVDKTIALLREFGMTQRCVIACFDAAILRYTHEFYPEFHLQGFPGRFMHHFTEDTYDIMFGMGIPISGRNTTPEQLREDVQNAKSRGILAWLYCADTPEDVEVCVNNQCDNITGNDPAVALTTLRRMGLHK